MTAFSPQLFMTGHLLPSHSFAPSPQEQQGTRSCDNHPTPWHWGKAPKKGPAPAETHMELPAPTCCPCSSDPGSPGLPFVPHRLQSTRAAPCERAAMKTQQLLSERHSYQNRTQCETKRKNNWLYFSLRPNVLFLQDIHSKKHCLPGHKLM